MDREYYTKKGFELYAIMTPSDKYTQGIEIMYPSNPIKSDDVPAVYILRTVQDLWVYVLPMPIIKEKILGYKCETSFVKGLEYNLLKEYKDKNGVVPPLNIFIK